MCTVENSTYKFEKFKNCNLNLKSIQTVLLVISLKTSYEPLKPDRVCYYGIPTRVAQGMGSTAVASGRGQYSDN